ncbi:hypothetical protein [Candidatus Regiella endosymbiont of Tuberolachnus salignus]|uniref:hypothetical protein n=1 Tax=Candidatus Regiella endosymbiont of Tuberolachnus salignus TaxID=3077956 RepID=UPI0030D095E1
MNTQPPRDLLFELYYSYYLEKMTETLNRRIDKLGCFFQMFLGLVVVVNSAYGWLCGILIASMSGFQFSFKPGEVAGHAKNQALKYRQLIDEIEKISPDIIAKKRLEIEKEDSPTLSSLFNPARKRAAITLNYPQEKPLTLNEKCFAWMAGGIPS